MTSYPNGYFACITELTEFSAPEDMFVYTNLGIGSLGIYKVLFRNSEFGILKLNVTLGHFICCALFIILFYVLSQFYKL